MSRQVDELELETRAGRLTLLHWPAADSAAQKVLCLHGWLDNAASFLPLAQHLQGLDLYALDFPGHGHSDHRPPGVRYTLTEYVFDLDAVLDALGWETAALLGHSMGGGVSCLYAAAMPERIRRIVLVDGLGPYTVDVSKTASQLRNSLEWVRRARRPLRRFESIEAATRARENGFLTISSEAARIIVERAVREAEDEGGATGDPAYVWRTDPRLKWDSPVLISEAQILSCLQNVTAPVLSFHAQPWTATQAREHMARRQAALRHGQFRDVEGNHHFHMDEAERIAPEIEAFFTENTP
ncbi:MAG: alpha/beta hydrolase [Xanthomonadales bacterium]|nr:alpha/beta hydrolase [Xanthomonadales bacterium]